VGDLGACRGYLERRGEVWPILDGLNNEWFIVKEFDEEMRNIHMKYT
jgi:hypothetical protein